MRDLKDPQRISIHAPSRERHEFSYTDEGKPLISIHAPSRERRKAGLAKDVIDEFQSTLPRGSDKEPAEKPEQQEISIHAPSRERLTSSPTTA